MGSIARIVVPLDGSDTACRAIPVAEALARQLHASIALVAVAVHPEHVAAAQQILSKGAEQSTVPVESEVLLGDTAGSRLVAYVEQHRSSLVVMSTHARRAVGELLLGSVADEVVRHSPVPVVLIGPHVDAPTAGAPYCDLIVCLDGRREAERLLPLAGALERDGGLHPWLFQVVDPGDGAAMAPSGDVFEAGYVHRLADRLEATSGVVDFDVGHDRDRADAILRFAADRSTPLIAVATHGRDPLSRLSAGSVTVGVARAASCPVMVISPAYQEAFATP